MPNCLDSYPISLYSVQDNVWRSSDHELSDTGLGSGATDVWIIFQQFDKRYNSRGNSIRGIRIVQRNITTDFA